MDHDDEISPMESQAEGPAQSSSDPKSSSVSYTLLTPSLDGPPPGQVEFTQAEEEETVRLRSEQELQQKGEEPEQQLWTSDAGENKNYTLVRSESLNSGVMLK